MRSLYAEGEPALLTAKKMMMPSRESFDKSPLIAKVNQIRTL